jgi:RNA polymerase sigma-70 factor (ECF subfamily)
LEAAEPGVKHLKTIDERESTLDYLVRRFGDRVIKLAYYHVRDRYLAEDICQEVFCRVYKNLNRFRGDSAYYTWIYRITVNLCRDYKASAYFRRMLPTRMEEEVAAAAESRMFEAAEGGDLFLKVMDLPLNLRTVIALYYFEEMKTTEIAQTLGISEDNVRTRLCRGRELLRERLSQEERIK